jgi:multiple sugar transport system substrate-binding protein
MGCDAPQMDIADENIVRFETEVMTIPQFDTEDPMMISQGPSVCIFNKEDPQEVLASWIFTQYLLTNEVQISYATIEGYIPVTSKAQETEEYKDYLSRGGEDNAHYYDVKIKTTQLMLDNIDNTFITPVFNGSTSLRNTAGDMIENVCKAIRGKKTVDDAYIEKLYDDMVSLYRLDQIGSAGHRADLGALPTESVVLLSSIAIIWVLIIAYSAVKSLKKQKNK